MFAVKYDMGNHVLGRSAAESRRSVREFHSAWGVVRVKTVATVAVYS